MVESRGNFIHLYTFLYELNFDCNKAKCNEIKYWCKERKSYFSFKRKEAQDTQNSSSSTTTWFPPASPVLKVALDLHRCPYSVVLPASYLPQIHSLYLRSASLIPLTFLCLWPRRPLPCWWHGLLSRLSVLEAGVWQSSRARCITLVLYPTPGPGTHLLQAFNDILYFQSTLQFLAWLTRPSVTWHLTCPLPEPLALHPSPQPRALFGDLQTSPVLVLSCAWKALPSHTNHFPLVNSYPSTFCWGHLLQGVFALPDLNIQSLSHPPIPVSLSSVGLFVWVSICPSPTLLSDLLED